MLGALLALVLTGGAADPLAALEARQQAIFERVAPSVVFIQGADGFGSGFFVSDDGLVLTNAHVVGKASKVAVVLHDGRRLEGEVVERAPDAIDLALVRVKASRRPLPLGGRSLRVGSWVASVGHGAGGAWAFTTGMITNIYPWGSERPLLQTQIPLNPGNSGGPIVDREGRAVGIVTKGLAGSDSINFAIRMEFALRSLEGLRAACDCLSISAPTGIPVLVDGEMVGKGPVVVLPAEARTYRVQAVVDGRLRQVDVSYPEVRSVSLE